MNEIPMSAGRFICVGCCQGDTELVIDTLFSTKKQVVLRCPKCDSNWSLCNLTRNELKIVEIMDEG